MANHPTTPITRRLRVGVIGGDRIDFIDLNKMDAEFVMIPDLSKDPTSKVFLEGFLREFAHCDLALFLDCYRGDAGFLQGFAIDNLPQGSIARDEERKSLVAMTAQDLCLDFEAVLRSLQERIDAHNAAA